MSIKHLGAEHMRAAADFQRRSFDIHLPPDVTYADLLVPSFWAHHARKLSKFDIVRVIAHDHSFDLDLTVVTSLPGGLVMKPRPLFFDATAMAALEASGLATESRLTAVPLDRDGTPIARVDFTPATKWRVINISGGEVKRDMATEAEAQLVFAKYLTETGLVLPPKDTVDVAMAEAEGKASKRRGVKAAA